MEDLEAETERDALIQRPSHDALNWIKGIVAPDNQKANQPKEQMKTQFESRELIEQKGKVVEGDSRKNNTKVKFKLTCVPPLSTLEDSKRTINHHETYKQAGNNIIVREELHKERMSNAKLRQTKANLTRENYSVKKQIEEIKLRIKEVEKANQAVTSVFNYRIYNILINKVMNLINFKNKVITL